MRDRLRLLSLGDTRSGCYDDTYADDGVAQTHVNPLPLRTLYRNDPFLDMNF
jgi:hypothetical protein